MQNEMRNEMNQITPMEISYAEMLILRQAMANYVKDLAETIDNLAVNGCDYSSALKTKSAAKLLINKLVSQ